MNDPGLEEPAQEAAQDVERDTHEMDQENAEAEEQDFLDPRFVHHHVFEREKY
jgi:potassium channel subfamily K